MLIILDGKTLSRIIEGHNLVILNDRFPTILLRSNVKSIIDLVLISECFASQAHSRTGLDTAGSDHFPIFTTIDSNHSTRKNVFLHKLKINKKDLIRLSHSLHDNFINLESNLSEDTLEAYQQMEHHIKEHLYSFFPPDSRIPRSCVSRKRPPPPNGMKRVNLQSMNAEILRINISHIPLSLTLLNTNESDQVARKFLKNKNGLVGGNTVCSSIIKLPHRRFGHLSNFSKKESLLIPLYFQIRIYMLISFKLLLLNCVLLLACTYNGTLCIC